MHLSFICAALVLVPLSSPCGTWYVAPNGLDTSPGTGNSPFATIKRAQTAASANDVVYLRGGTYFLNNSNLTANVFDVAGNWALSNALPVGVPQQFYRLGLP